MFFNHNKKGIIFDDICFSFFDRDLFEKKPAHVDKLTREVVFYNFHRQALQDFHYMFVNFTYVLKIYIYIYIK